MGIKDFIGKVVCCSANGKEYILSRITAPTIVVQAVEPNAMGYREYFSYSTVSGDPISNGTLVFKDPSLKKSFLNAYEAYCHSKEAYFEEIGYWMRKDQFI